MSDLLIFVNKNVAIFDVLVSLVTAIITLVCVIFTFWQARIAQKALKTASMQMRVEKQPCIVYEDIKTEGTNCFWEDRRQLHINLTLQNIGDSPAMCVYVFSHLELQYAEDGNGIVDMYYLPDFVPYINVGSKADASIRYEEVEIDLLIEDLSIGAVKNAQRIKTDATRESYKGTVLVVETYYKNMLGQWFKNERHVEILDILERKEGGKKEIVDPPNSLKDDVWFELELIAPAFSLSNIQTVDEKEIKDRLIAFERDRPFVDTKSSI